MTNNVKTKLLEKKIKCAIHNMLFVAVFKTHSNVFKQAMGDGHKNKTPWLRRIFGRLLQPASGATITN